MEQQTQKKEWKTPELIVLVRSKPEEAVLAACKNCYNRCTWTYGKLCQAPANCRANANC